MLAQRLGIDRKEAGNVGFGHAIAGERLDLATLDGIGLVTRAGHDQSIPP